MIDIKALRKTADHCLKKLHAADTPHPTNWIIQMHPATVLALCDEIESLRLPDDWYPESKDWRESPAERGLWLRVMYEQAKEELNQLQEQNTVLDAKLAEVERDAEKYRLRVALTQAEIEHGGG